MRGLVTGIQTNPDDGTIKLQGNLGSVTTKPQVTDGRVALQVVDVTGLGLLLPTEIVQSALDAFTTHLTENYPLDIHADSVQITDGGVTAHYSTRDMSIPQGNQGNQGNKDPAAPQLAPAQQPPLSVPIITPREEVAANPYAQGGRGRSTSGRVHPDRAASRRTPQRPPERSPKRSPPK